MLHKSTETCCSRSQSRAPSAEGHEARQSKEWGRALLRLTQCGDDEQPGRCVTVFQGRDLWCANDSTVVSAGSATVADEQADELGADFATAVFEPSEKRPLVRRVPKDARPTTRRIRVHYLPSFNGRAPSANGHEALNDQTLNVAHTLEVLHLCVA